MSLERFDQTDKTAQLAGAAFDAVNVFVVLQSTVKTGLVCECIVGYPVDRRKTNAALRYIDDSFYGNII